MARQRESKGGVKTFVIDLSPVECEIWPNTYHSETGEPVMVPAKQPVREFLKKWLFHRDRNLTYNNGGIPARRCAEKIHDAKGTTVTLNEDEYQGLLEAVKTAPGITFNDMAVIDRVVDAKEKTLATG